MKLFLLIFILIFQVHATQEIYEAEGVFYKTNRFGDIFPIWQNIPQVELKNKLITFVEAVKEKGSPIILEIPHEKSPLLNTLIQASFSLYHADQVKSEWIIKNESPIPHPFTAISGAHVMVLKDDKVLVVEEITRKGILGFPAGGAEPGEFARDVACRELREEVGLIVEPQDLKLIALINRLKVNKQGASLYGHCFVAIRTAGTINIDPKEIAQAFWIPLSELSEASEINGLKVNAYSNALAKHILNGCKTSFFATLPDPGQTPDSSPPIKLMNVEFFKQELLR